MVTMETFALTVSMMLVSVMVTMVSVIGPNIKFPAPWILKGAPGVSDQLARSRVFLHTGARTTETSSQVRPQRNKGFRTTSAFRLERKDPRILEAQTSSLISLYK